MAIIRTECDENFTVIRNEIFNNDALTFEARGLLCTLLSKPAHWNVHVNQLVKETRNSRKPSQERAIRAMLNELIEAGYVIRKKQQSGEMDYYVFDKPQIAHSANCENRKLQNPQTAKSANCENRNVLERNNNNKKEIKKDKKELSCADAFCADADASAAPLDGDFEMPSEIGSAKPVELSAAVLGVAESAEFEPAEQKRKRKAANPANVQTWNAYRAAYLQAYGVEPLRNAKVNGQVASFVKLVGEDKAPHIAAFYVMHSNHWYRTKGHDFGTLLQNAQALATDWQRNRQTTAVQTRQAERTAANVESHKGALEILKAKGLV